MEVIFFYGYRRRNVFLEYLRLERLVYGFFLLGLLGG